MVTYKIGNKVKAIIRSFSACKIGDVDLQYDNQPYTFINEVDAFLSFSSNDSKSQTDEGIVLAFNHDTLKEVRLNNVPMTNRILQLVYKDNPDKLFAVQEWYESDNDKKIYLNLPTSEVYQVFVYNEDGVLEQAFGTLSEDAIKVNEANTKYSIYYSYIAEKSFYLDKPENFYITIDLECIGNENDGTQPMSIHIEKCMLACNKNISLRSSGTNTIDLIGTVIHTGKDFITIK